MSAEYEAGRILHDAWHNVGRAIAPPFDLIDQFDRLRWIETAKISNAAEREAIIDLVAMYGGPVDLEAAIRARGNT
jgi:hypothetical protein